MAEKRRVGEIRPSQLLFTYGIGAIVDRQGVFFAIQGELAFGDAVGIAARNSPEEGVP